MLFASKSREMISVSRTFWGRVFEVWWFEAIIAFLEGVQKKSAQNFYFIPQKWLILESKVKLEVKTMGQEL